MLIATRQESNVHLLDKSAETPLAIFATDLGWTAIAVRGRTLRALVFGHSSKAKAEAAIARTLSERDAPAERTTVVRDHLGRLVIEQLVDELERFAAGEPVDFSHVALDESHLTSFGRRIVAACRRIPYGQTRSYGQLAAVCGSSAAARAVGQVMAKNRFPLVVPCHRVLGAGGTIGGFSAPDGLTMKRRLLALEGSWL